MPTHHLGDVEQVGGQEPFFSGSQFSRFLQQGMVAQYHLKSLLEMYHRLRFYPRNAAYVSAVMRIGLLMKIFEVKTGYQRPNVQIVILLALKP